MTTDDALAAGQDGTVSVLAPQTQDEIYRQAAVQELADHLAKGKALLMRCQSLANAARGDRLGPLYAAARMLNADANVARAFAQVALVERRTRTIVETIQQPVPENPDLISASQTAKMREELEREIASIVSAAEREQEDFDGLAIGCCI